MEKIYTQEYAAQIETAMADEAMLEALANAQSKEEIISLFADKGIEMEEEMAQEVYTNIRRVSESGELDEEMLDAVNGGFSLAVAAGVVVGFITFYITVQVGIWVVNKILR